MSGPLLEHQATLILCNDTKLERYTLHEHCYAATMSDAAKDIHSSIRKKLNSNDTFFIEVIDETESCFRCFKCSVDLKPVAEDNKTESKKYVTTMMKKINNEGKNNDENSDENSEDFDEYDVHDEIMTFFGTTNEGVLKTFNDDVENLINNNLQELVKFIQDKIREKELRNE